MPRPPAARTHAVRARQRGLSIMELMVGLTVGMLLVAGLALMFGNASRNSAELDRSARHIENGRHAIDLLSEDLGLAGYYGTVPLAGYADTVSPCANAADVVANLTGTHAAATPVTMPFPVRGYSPADAAVLATSTSPACLPNYKAGTPVLVLRRLDTAVVPAASLGAAPFLGLPFVQASHNVADANNFDRFVAATDGSGMTLRDKAGNVNPARRFISRAYYIATCNDCSGAGDAVPTLKRTELRAGANPPAAVPLAEGIDQVGFDYGFDTSGDGVVDSWIGLNGGANATEATAAATAGWGNVVAVRVYLVSRQTEATPGHGDSRTYQVGSSGSTMQTLAAPADAFKRRAFQTTVRLNNPAGLRGTP